MEMTEQEKREKVINGLECCLLDGWETCRNCRYYCGNCHECTTRMKSDALALLKEQEPRVMTFDEVKEHYNLPNDFIGDLDMKEEYYQDIRPLYFEFLHPSAWDVHWRCSDKVRMYLDEWENRYNKTWRCWTSRPTDEQREEANWDE